MSWTITPQTKVPVDPYRSQVSLLLHGDGANGSTTIVDNSPNPKTVTAVGNAQISTAQSKFGGSSIAFDGVGDYLTVAPSTDFALGTADFTIELFLYLISYVGGAGSPIIFDFRPQGTQGNYPLLYIAGGTNSIRFYVNSADKIVATNFLSLNDWIHIAVSRSGGSTRLFIDGVQRGSTFADTTDYAVGTLRPWIGANASTASGGGNLNGYIDELRITKGIARYQDSFTPPTAPLPDA